MKENAHLHKFASVCLHLLPRCRLQLGRASWNVFAFKFPVDDTFLPRDKKWTIIKRTLD